MRYRIRESREARGLSQAELARMLGTSQQQIAKWENGKTDLRASAAVRLSDALNVSLPWLLGSDLQDRLPDSLTPEETTLLLRYRNMSNQGREALDRTAKLFFEYFPAETKETKDPPRKPVWRVMVKWVAALGVA